MVRHQARSSQDESRWLFARSTVTSVDALYGSLNARWVRSRLPPPLLAPGPLSLYVWQWLAIPFLALLCAALGRVFTWLTALTATALTSKIPWGRRIVLRLKGPVTMAWALGGFWALTPYLALTLRAEDLVRSESVV